MSSQEGTVIHLFGAVSVEVAGQRLVGFRSQKTLALLGYLAAEQRPVMRDHLAAFLWPDASPAEARGHLRRSLHDLISKVPGCISADYHSAQISPEAIYRTDIARFDALRAEGDRASLEAAATLCRGELLEGIYLEDCPDFSVWLLAEREKYRARAIEVLESVLNSHLEMGNFAAALEYAWQLFKLEPWREMVFRQTMLLLARSGRRNAALRHYRICERILAEELSVEPSDDTRRLYERIRRSQSIPPNNLPQTLTPFVGRENELNELFQALNDPGTRLLSLTGPRGIGKTRLAIEAGRQAISKWGFLFLDGVYFVSLDQIMTGGELVTALVSALGLPQNSKKPATLNQLLRFVGAKEILFILDDCRQPHTYRDVLLTILERSPLVKVLATSRFQPGLSARWHRQLDGLMTEPGGFPEEESEALSMFLSFAALYGATDLSEDERVAAAHVCRLLKGMPRAIEAAASWTNAMSCRDIVRQLEGNCNLFTLARRSVVARQAQLRAEPSFR